MQNLQPSDVIVVTGATGGIGSALVKALLEARCDVIGVGRDPERCEQASAKFSADFPGSRVAYIVADLADQAQVRELAQSIRAQLAAWQTFGLRGLINNAGAFTFWQTLTAEGFETQWAVNHLAHFLLTVELMPELRQAAEARVITVSSGSHYGAQMEWDDLQLMRRYNPLKAYKQTKLANVIFTVELNRRLGERSNVRAFAADPGLVDTDIGAKTNSRFAQWIWSLRRRSGISPERSARGIVQLMLSEDPDRSQAIYWKHGKPKKPSPHALQPEDGWRLWELSAQMCGVSPRLEAV